VDLQAQRSECHFFDLVVASCVLPRPQLDINVNACGWSAAYLGHWGRDMGGLKRKGEGEGRLR
jgi:hypothetical protein